MNEGRRNNGLRVNLLVYVERNRFGNTHTHTRWGKGEKRKKCEEIDSGQCGVAAATADLLVFITNFFFFLPRFDPSPVGQIFFAFFFFFVRRFPRTRYDCVIAQCLKNGRAFNKTHYGFV